MFARPNSQHSQVAYVTNDLVAAMDLIKAEYGAPGFFKLSNIQPGEDPSGKPVLKIAMTVIGGVEIELIEPVGDTAPIFRDVLPEGDDLAIRFHHVAERIGGPIANWDAHLSSIDQARHPVVFDGGVGDMLRYIYTDERAFLGHFVEHVWMSPELLAQMKELLPAYPSSREAAQ